MTVQTNLEQINLSHTTFNNNQNYLIAFNSSLKQYVVDITTPQTNNSDYITEVNLDLFDKNSETLALSNYLKYKAKPKKNFTQIKFLSKRKNKHIEIDRSQQSEDLNSVMQENTIMNDEKNISSFINETHLLAGTVINTTHHHKTEIENLVIGDQILSYDIQNQQELYCQVKSIKKKNVKINTSNTDTNLYPIRILKNAIAPNVPNQDLLVTQGYCIFFNNHFIPISLLVNSYNIYYDYNVTEYTHYNIKLEKHALIKANGILTKTSFSKFEQQKINHNSDPKELFTQPFHIKKQKKDIFQPITTNITITKTLFNKFLTRAHKMGLKRPECLSNS